MSKSAVSCCISDSISTCAIYPSLCRPSMLWRCWLVQWRMEYFAMEVWSVWVRGHCRIDPPRFLAECRKRRLDQDSFVLLYFRLSTLFDLYLVLYAYFLVLYLYLVSVCLFSCTALFVSISQVIGCEDRLRNDLHCVGWGVKLYSTNPTR